MTGGDKITNFESTGINDDATSTAITINSSGNVGIGTTAPASALTVSDGTASGLTPFGGTDLFLDSSADNYLQFGSGTSSSPAIYFGDSADGDVGGIIYAHTSDAMSFRTNAAERMRIDSSGRVGIGVSTIDSALSTKLHVAGTIRTDTGSVSANPAIVFDHDNFGDADANYIMLDRTSEAMRFSVNASERVRIDSSGNVGIGTSSSANKLEVNGAIVALGAVTAYTNTGLYLQNKGSSVFDVGAWRSGASVAELTFSTDSGSDAAPVERMRINSSGNVGIGTSSPRAPLHVQPAGGASDDFNVLVSQFRPNIVLEDLSGSSTDFQFFVDANAFQIRSGDASTDTKLASERMRITSAGNVGIGNAAPSYLLDLYKAASTVARVRNSAATGGTPSVTHGEFVIESTDANMGMQFLGSTTADQRILFSDTAAVSGQIVYNHTSNYMALSANGSERVRIDSSGNVGIGTTAPAEKLDVNGNIKTNAIFSDKPADFWSAGASFFGVDTLGSLTTQGSYEVTLTANGYRGAGSLWVSQNNNSQTGATQLTLNPAGYMSFRTEAVKATGAGATVTERMRITSAGLVGIGTSSPTAELDIESTSPEIHLNDSDGVLGAAVTSRMIFQAGGSTQGRVGFGTSAGNMALTNLQGNLFIQADTNNAQANSYITFSVDNSTKMRITSTGNVGIGTTAPAKQLHITKSAKADIGVLTDGATITPNFDAKQNFIVTLGGNRTLANPTNADGGQTGSIFVVQDATGGRTLSFGANWKFAGGTAPTLSTGANAVDRIDYIVKSSTQIHAVVSLNLS